MTQKSFKLEEALGLKTRKARVTNPRMRRLLPPPADRASMVNSRELKRSRDAVEERVQAETDRRLKRARNCCEEESMIQSSVAMMQKKRDVVRRTL